MSSGHRMKQSYSISKTICKSSYTVFPSPLHHLSTHHSPLWSPLWFYSSWCCFFFLAGGGVGGVGGGVVFKFQCCTFLQSVAQSNRAKSLRTVKTPVFQLQPFLQDHVFRQINACIPSFSHLLIFKMGEHKWSYLPYTTAKDKTREQTWKNFSWEALTVYAFQCDSQLSLVHGLLFDKCCWVINPESMTYIQLKTIMVN